MRHVHDAHQPERQREAAREQEEERGERDAVDRLEDARSSSGSVLGGDAGANERRGRACAARAAAPSVDRRELSACTAPA